MGFRFKIERTKKKSGQFGKRMVLFCIGAAIAYTVYGLWMQVELGVMPDSTITTGVYAALFGELWELSKIKRNKQRSDGVENTDEE